MAERSLATVSPPTQDENSLTAFAVQRLMSLLRLVLEIQLIPSLLAMKTVSTYLMIRFGQPHRIISMNLIKQVFQLISGLNRAVNKWRGISV